jgi:hypothetical protein
MAQRDFSRHPRHSLTVNRQRGNAHVALLIQQTQS